MCNEEFLLGCFHENASFCMAVNGGRVPVPRCFDSCIFQKDGIGGVFLFFPPTDWNLNSQFKNCPKHSSLFWKAFPAFKLQLFRSTFISKDNGCPYRTLRGGRPTEPE